MRDRFLMMAAATGLAFPFLGCSGEGAVAPSGIGQPGVSPSRAPAEWVAFSFRTFDECTGEWVSGEYEQLFRTHRLTDMAGGVHERILLTRRGNAVGEGTGVRYQFHSTQVLARNDRWDGDTGTLVITFQARSRLVSMGPTADRFMYTNFRFVNDRNGEIVVDKDDRRITC